jgi:tetratricopeptide (TPR) repeat protein
MTVTAKIAGPILMALLISASSATPSPAASSPDQAPAAAASTAVPAEPFAAAPPELRAFFVKAKAADAIADPLQRCLAFPDLPGNQWPKGLAEWYCESSFGPHIEKSRVEALIKGGAWAELNALFRADLDRHFTPDNQSEAIHVDVNVLADTGPDQDQLSKRWLDNDPDSPFANAVRAAYLSSAGIEARGVAYRDKTPPENFVKMEALTSQAVKLFDKALMLEPKLTPAHVGLIHLGGYGAPDDTVESAYQLGTSIAPHCRLLTTLYMSGLRPKWGGSMEEMDAYAGSLKPLAEIYPQHRLTMMMPDLERANILQEENQTAASIPVLEPLILQTPSALPLESLAMAQKGGDNATNWKILMQYLAAYRYSDGDGCCEARRGLIQRSRGAMMVSVGQTEWALPSLIRADRLKPHDPATNFWLGYAYFKLERFALAEAPLVEGLGDTENRLLALDYLMTVTTELKKPANTLKYATILTTERPANSRAWFALGRAQFAVGEIDQSMRSAEVFLATVDRKDPANASWITGVEQMLAHHHAVQAGQKGKAAPPPATK